MDVGLAAAPSLHLLLASVLLAPLLDEATPTSGKLLVFNNDIYNLERIYIFEESASAQIYHCSTSPGSISGIVIYILPQRRTDKGNILITYTYDG